MEAPKLAPFLTFCGKAEEAMKFYTSALPNAEIKELVLFGKNHPYAKEGEENLVLFGSLSIAGYEIMFQDMGSAHAVPSFSWSTSLYIKCDDEAEFDAIFNALSQGGVVMMGPESVGHIRKCAWITDKYGITWQPVWE
ncbi:MAG: VOC family protein [Defluviitaleaceae bacterium]|nr:VOC family protein [Defluviitaleaceae bacterium]